MEENPLKWDFELLDRYQNFSAEVLRLSLVTLAAFGFFLSIEKGEGLRIAHVLVREPISRWLVGGGLVALVVAAATALAHRYVSSDSMWYVITNATKGLDEKDRTIQNAMLKRSGLAVMGSSVALAIGVGCLVLAFLMAW